MRTTATLNAGMRDSGSRARLVSWLAAFAPGEWASVGMIASVNASTVAYCAAVSAFGRVDVLVNNAGLYGGLKGARFEHLDEAQWDAVMNINVKGLWQCCKAVVEPMRATGGGSIINISSLAAVYGLEVLIHQHPERGHPLIIAR